MAVLCRFNQIYIESKKIMTQFVKKGNKNYKKKRKENLNLLCPRNIVREK